MEEYEIEEWSANSAQGVDLGQGEAVAAVRITHISGLSLTLATSNPQTSTNMLQQQALKALSNIVNATPFREV